jgi:hypothetical protein
MMIAPPIFIDGVELSILGPMENGWGPKEVYERLMTPPLHPMSIKKVIHHLTFQGMEEPSTKVIVVHPAEGMRVIDLPVFRRAVDKGKHINFRAGVNYPVEECLVVTMHWSQHPERTIAYRIEERPTGRVFVFLTDEEVRAEIPGTLQTFLKGAHLLIEDAQYLEEVYRTRTAGYGHGTPGYAVRLALMGGIPHLGLIHHDPTSSDDDIDALVAEGQLAADGQLTVFACADRQEIEV